MLIFEVLCQNDYTINAVMDGFSANIFASESIRTSGPVFLFSQPLQCGVIVVILLISIITNCSVIINIINSDIKKSIVTFVIIKNLCIVDLCGACLILPSPLAATIKGEKNMEIRKHHMTLKRRLSRE